jgi:cold shock protein
LGFDVKATGLAQEQAFAEMRHELSSVCFARVIGVTWRYDMSQAAARTRWPESVRDVCSAAQLKAGASARPALDYEGLSAMAKGTVKWFNSDKGFGFIQPDEGDKDVFVHITAVHAAGLQTLQDNQPIEYELVDGRDGRMSAGELKV